MKTRTLLALAACALLGACTGFPPIRGEVSASYRGATLKAASAGDGAITAQLHLGDLEGFAK